MSRDNKVGEDGDKNKWYFSRERKGREKKSEKNKEGYKYIFRVIK